jgi:hypothetical protein
VSKDSTGISLVPATGIKNIFVNDWKPNFASNALKRIASIPFMRNLVEFTKGEGDPYFKALTSLLHIRPESEATVEQDLFDIYNSLFGAAEVAADGGQGTVLDLIETECTSCLAAPAGVNFENKIVLSIAVRLKAERIMIDAINDPDFLQAIKRNQTSVLLRKFKKKFPDRIADAIILDRVSLMTPENIHLNSFMYEPILDMSDEHLRQLYADLEKIS